MSIITFLTLVFATFFALRSIKALSIVLVYVMVLYFAVGCSIKTMVRLGKAVTLLSVFVVVINGLLVPGAPLVVVRGFSIFSREGLAAGGFFALRVVVLYVSMTVFFVVTPPEKFADGVFSLLRPISKQFAGRAAFYGFLTLSYIPLFAEEFERIRAAQSFRGVALRGGFLRRIASVRLLLVPLVLSAVHRSEQLAVIVETRGLKDGFGSAPLRVAPSAKDYLFLAVTLAVLVTGMFLVRGGS